MLHEVSSSSREEASMLTFVTCRYFYILEPTGGNVSICIAAVPFAVGSCLTAARARVACAKFTPKLHLFNQLQDGKEEYEIVFCSMDRSEDEYKAYAEQMPWWCLPYALSTLPRLATIYHAHGMPHLVVLDTDGKVITRNGVESLTHDPVGKQFPWRPTRIVELLPEYYIIEENEDEAMLPFSDLDDKYILLFFAAKSDSLSQEFTPWLVKAYNILKKKRPDDFEVRRRFSSIN